MKHRGLKTTAYRLLAMLLVATTLGANLTTLSYAKVDGAGEEETYCGRTEHIHEETLCWVEKPELICEIEEGFVHQHDEKTCYREKLVLVCEEKECAPHVHDETCWKDVEKNVCGQTEHAPHIHDETCIRLVPELICKEKVRPAHAHDETCYKTVNELTCGKEECDPHTHGDGCYGMVSVCICGEEECAPHAHGDGCYKLVSVCICGEKEHDPHAHGADCYEMVPVRTCGETEYAAHSHDDSCYTTDSVLTCTEPESDTHTHGDGCYTEKKTLSCKLREGAGHAHDETCYEEQEKLTCKIEETPGHTHDETCYEEQEKLTCKTKETEGHTHDETCYTEQQKLSCGLEETEGHAHGETCWQAKEKVICGKEESAGHTHDETCFVLELAIACGLEETEGHTHIETCFEKQNTLVCKESTEPHVHVEELCYEMTKDIFCELEEHVHTAKCYIPDDPDIGTFCGIPAHEHTDACYEYTKRLTCELEENADHTHGDECYTLRKKLICTQKVHTHTDECYIEYIPQELTAADGSGITVSGDFPAGVEMALEALPLTAEDVFALTEEIDPARVFFAYDISLYADGEEYQPAKPVTVTVECDMEMPEGAEIAVQHLVERSTGYRVETVDGVYENGKVTFTAESFSVYIGVVTGTDPVEVELLSGEGYAFYDANDKPISGPLVWDKNNAVTIKVKPNTGYAIESVTVKGMDDSEGVAAVNEADGVYTISFTGEPVVGTPAQIITVVAKRTSDIVYFDLALGNVSISNTGFSGMIYNQRTGKDEKVSGSYDAKQTYYIYQSTAANKTQTGYNSEGKVVVPDYDPVKASDGQTWGDYITDNTNIMEATIKNGEYDITGGVIYEWEQAAGKVDRTVTNHIITISLNGAAFDVTLDNIWANEGREGGEHTSAVYGELRVTNATSAGSTADVRLKGDNRMSKIYYYCSKDNTGELNFTSSAGNGRTSGTLTVIGDQKLIRANGPYTDVTGNSYNTPENNWNGVIGGTDNYGEVYGLNIHGATIYAGSTPRDNCTAIGGGGNSMGEVTITGGRVTAVAHTTGTAIGGGIGHQSNGGEGRVTITGGRVYAYNFGQPAYETIDSYGTTNKDVLYAASHIPSAAIGGGSSIISTGTKGTVTITGGYVYAESLGGSALGGGSSIIRKAGDAIINISGGTVIAKSTEQKNYATVKYNGADRNFDVVAGAAIGGGTGGIGSEYGNPKAWDACNGGTANVNISGGTVKTGSIGGGQTRNKERSDADIAAGKTAGKIGAAKFEMSGGTVYGQVIMAGGGTSKCTFNMSGGTLSAPLNNAKEKYLYLQKDGGVVWMDDSIGVATISGDALITGASAQNGGAIYMTDGQVFVNGGAIQNCRAYQSGGAIYMGGGELHITGGTIGGLDDDGQPAGNKALAGNGGGACVENGIVVMSGGEVSYNEAVSGNGGGIYVSAISKDATVDVFSGALNYNTAAVYGGALAVEGKSAERKVEVTLGLNREHIYNGDEFAPINHSKTTNGENYTYIHTACPVINGNSVPAGSKGGAVYVTGVPSSDPAIGMGNTLLAFYCTYAEGNEVGNDGPDKRDRSDFMMVEGGKVVISASEKSHEDYGDTEMTPAGDDDHGSTLILGNVYVKGGEVDLYGDMENPSLENYWITVDIEEASQGHFFDHRYNDGTYYKVLYFENFKDSGQYTGLQVKDGELHEIMGAIYQHPGFTLQGWFTKEIGEIGEQRHNVADKYLFEDAKVYKTDSLGNPAGDALGYDQYGNMNLYAIWEPFGYTVYFDANVPSGVVVGGKEMEPQSFAYDVEQNLTSNTYKRNGYQFLGWTLEKDNETLPVQYNDGDPVTNLPMVDGGEMVDGAEVTLYAKWKKCNHDDTCKFTYTVIDDGETLQRDCECGGQTLKAELSARDTVYDGEEHRARVDYTDPSAWKPPVEYSYYDEEAGKYISMDEGDFPVDAGEYRASVSDPDGKKTASVVYEIDKAPQDPPEKPTYTVEGDTLTVHDVEPSSKAEIDPDIKTHYQLFYYVAVDGEVEECSSDVVTQNGNETITFNLEETFTNYYVKVWYGEGKNHKESDDVDSDSTFYEGNTRIDVVAEPGIKYYRISAQTTGVMIYAWADEGFYLTSDFKMVDDNDVTVLTPQPDDDGKKVYWLTDIPADAAVVTVYITGVKAKPSIVGNVKEKQVFGSVTGTAATVSNDSAYTVYYDVKNFDPAVHSGLQLKFEQALPAGTTIILQDKSGTQPTYWYANATGTSIDLTAFDKMGGSGGWSVDGRTDMELQFVVDFSHVSTGWLSGSLETTLVMVEQGGGDDAVPDAACELPVTLVNKADFTLSVTKNTGLEQTITYQYTPSAAAASKWDGCDAAMVLELPEDIPADLVLKVFDGENTAWPRPNADRKVIIPLGKLAKGEQTITVTWLSELLPETDKEYLMGVKWYVADSLADQAPIGGYLAAEEETEFTVSGKGEYGIKITGERLVEDDALDIKVAIEGEEDLAIRAVVERKSDNGYTSAGQDVSISGGNMSVIMSQQYENGSYRLLVKATETSSMETILIVPYYFIIQK